MAENKSGIEEEQALVIRGDDPAGTADTIAALEQLGKKWYIVEEPDQLITDTYINTANRDLKGSSMRIREINDEKTLVTIKGKNINAGTGKPACRSELEVEWPYEEVSPWDIMDLFGMEVIQSRSTTRRVRNVYSKATKNLVAELAIDEVCYNFSEDNKVRIFEVEIENRRQDKFSDVEFICDALRKKYPELLKKWNNSKLSTGSLLRIALGIEVDEDGVVTDSSFDNLQTLFALI